MDPINGNTSRFERRIIRTIIAVVICLSAFLATVIVYQLATGNQLP